MCKIHGLAVLLLIIFEGTIIQCGNILSLFPSLPRNIRNQIRGGANLAELFKNYVVIISPYVNEGQPKTDVFVEGGEVFLSLGNFPNLKLFFETFGKHVTGIRIDYNGGSDLVHFNEFVKNVIVSRGNDLELLMIQNFGENEGVWSALTKDGNYVTFPNVKLFGYWTDSNRVPFELKPMFPKLKSFRQQGISADADCLANVTGLEELEVFTPSIQADQLRAIFEKNPTMTKVGVSEPTRETMRSMATILMNLGTLCVWHVSMDFLYKNENEEIHQFPLVEHFWFRVRYVKTRNEDPSFNMPNLKRLTIKVDNEAYEGDYRFIDLFRHSEKLKRIDFHMGEVPDSQIYQYNFYPDWVQALLENFEGTAWTCTVPIQWPYQPLVFERQLNNE